MLYFGNYTYFADKINSTENCRMYPNSVVVLLYAVFLRKPVLHLYDTYIYNIMKK